MSNSPPHAEIWAVIPVKNFAQAKMRLSGVLTPDQRHDLCQAMLSDVLVAACRATTLAGVLVVSCDPIALDLAKQKGADVLQEASSHGINQALTSAGQYLQAKNCSGMMIIPSDVPLVSADEIDEIISIHGTRSAITLIPAWDDGGTNAMVVTPCDVSSFHFGEDSFAAHKAAALNIDLKPTIINAAGLELDLDTPDDLSEFLNMGYDNSTSAFLENVMTPPVLKRGLG